MPHTFQYGSSTQYGYQAPLAPPQLWARVLYSHSPTNDVVLDPKTRRHVQVPNALELFKGSLQRIADKDPFPAEVRAVFSIATKTQLTTVPGVHRAMLDAGFEDLGWARNRNTGNTYLRLFYKFIHQDKVALPVVNVARPFTLDTFFYCCGARFVYGNLRPRMTAKTVNTELTDNNAGWGIVQLTDEDHARLGLKQDTPNLYWLGSPRPNVNVWAFNTDPKTDEELDYAIA